MQTISTPSGTSASPPFRIHRYPAALIDRVQLADGRSVIVRPVLPQDAALHQAFVRSLSPRSRYRRFHGPVAELPEPMLRYLNEIDYASHLALLAQITDPRAGEIQVAEARWVRREKPEQSHIADFALAVADGWQGVGLGAHLVALLEQSAAQAGIERLSGDVLAENDAMCGLLRRRGWRLTSDPDDSQAVVAELDLGKPRRPATNDRYLAAVA